jgi:hypothetical protein
MPKGTSQSTSDGYKLICFDAKSSNHLCLLEKGMSQCERAISTGDGSGSSFAMTQRVRAITGCSKGDEPSAPVLALAHHLQ